MYENFRILFTLFCVILKQIFQIYIVVSLWNTG